MNSKQVILRVLVLSFLALNILAVHAQFVNNCNYEPPHQADQWIFGNKARIEFNGETPNVNPTANSYSTPNGVSSIADADGNLVMFSNGLSAWNSGIYQMTNGDNLEGNNFASQSSLIVPNPGNSKQFYLFTVDMYIPPLFTDGVNYSLIDFNVEGGGQVIEKNKFLFTENSQKITGVQHANGVDYWVITHGFGTVTGKTFYTYLIDQDGLDTIPVKSNVGTSQQGQQNNSAGYMKTSPDGSKLALIIPDDGILEIFDFNNSTGQVSNPVTSAPGQFKQGFGIEFSPDNSKLYLSTSPLGNGTNYLYQMDLNASNPFSNPYIVHQFDVSELGGADSLMGALQLATDGKIYLAKFRRSIVGKSNLGVIYNPDRPQDACNYNELDYQSNNGLYLNGGESLIGLPTFITSFLDIPHFTYMDQCLNDTTKFNITNKANLDNTTWNFNNPSGTVISNDMTNPSFVFSDPGNYNVQLTESYDGANYNFSEQVTIYPLPYVDLGNGADTIYILPNTSVQLDAGEWDGYYWQPGGSTGRYLDVSQAGLYTVTVVDSNCCTNSDEVYVATSNLYYPNAFKPGSSNTDNSVFKVVGNTASLGAYSLQIFNRWGQMIFETENPSEGWDGTYKGEFVEVGTYIYSSVFQSFESSQQGSKEIKSKGTVTVIR